MTGGKQELQFGAWPSPVTASDVAAAGTRFGLCRMDGDTLYWSEFRPHEGPRTVIVRRGPSGNIEDVLPAGFSARSRVHEYGGGEYMILGERIVFVNEPDQDLYMFVSGETPQRLTEASDWRFADMAIAPKGSRVMAVGERHDPKFAHAKPQNCIVSVSLDDKSAAIPDLILAGRDFYAAPRLSRDGLRLAWLAWDLPSMPWEAAELWVGEVAEDGGIRAPRHIAGGDGSGAFQPEWSDDGDLYFVADHEGWGNLHVFDGASVRLVLADAAEYGRPLWQFGMASYATLGDGQLAASCWRGGKLELARINAHSGKRQALATGFTRLDSIAGQGDRVGILGGDDARPPGAWLCELPSGNCTHLAGAESPLDTDNISPARMMEIGTGADRLYALYYPPRQQGYSGLPGSRPPMVVAAHGGPTAMAKRGLDLEKQYWTTRGFAFLDVDYRGSFGYGRDYVRALDGNWGVADAEDAARAARYVADQGLADPGAMVILGSSAGGFTVLNALAGSTTFSAGASAYGVADLASLATDTHKFEAGYLYALMGAAPNDDTALAEIFDKRSPLVHADKITAPMIFLQGLDDAVVPPNQSQAMVESLRARGVPVVYLEFEGEGHGFRKPDTVVTALESTHAFFARILRLAPAESLPDLKIENLN